MFVIFLALAVGIVLGWLLRRNRRLIRACEKLVTASTWTLLFVLGASVGTNEQIVREFHRLAGRAGVICLGAVLGSLLACHLVCRRMFRGAEP